METSLSPILSFPAAGPRLSTSLIIHRLPVGLDDQPSITGAPPCLTAPQRQKQRRIETTSAAIEANQRKGLWSVEISCMAYASGALPTPNGVEESLSRNRRLR